MAQQKLFTVLKTQSVNLINKVNTATTGVSKIRRVATLYGKSGATRKVNETECEQIAV